jgi:hypothetical protein
VTGAPATQIPAWQASPCVQASPSLHVVPSGLLATAQVPVVGSQAETVVHGVAAGQTTGLPPVHAPLWQVSVCVHALPSLHGVPLALLGLEHTPVAGLQVPATWH